MKKTVIMSTTLLLALLCLGVMEAAAQAPNSLSYQGRLTETDGTAVASDTLVMFSIYDALSGGTRLWFDTIIVSPDSSGIFTVELDAINTSVFQSGNKRYLEIEVVGDGPMTPRQLLTSAPYAYATEMIADLSVTNAKLASSSVTSAKIASGGVQSSDILNNSIVNADISTSAAISTSKISGGAVNLNSTQTITGSKTLTGSTSLDGNVYFSDSAMRVNSSGVRIGDGGTPSFNYPLIVERNYNTTSIIHGLDVDMYNAGNGAIYGIYADVDAAAASTGSRIGIRGYAGSSSNTAGYSYGTYGSAFGGTYAYGLYGYAYYSSGTNYGIYASCGVSNGNYGAYFLGNMHSTGVNSKGTGEFKIDDPLDPENKYLCHSDVASPDMMNIYNGNVTTDGNGEAVVQLPDYFEALNKDFRYQLTVIGEFAQAIIADEISNNRFVIRTDKSTVKVSWQVTGIRKDLFAEANRVQAVAAKPANEVGLYMHPEVRGYGIERSVNYEHHKSIIEEEALEASERSE